MARQPRFSPGLSQEELARGYKKVGSRKPFTAKDIAKTLKHFGLKPANQTKGKRTKKTSDAKLARTAALAVVWRHKVDEHAKKAAKKK